MESKLIFEDGSIFTGTSFGYEGPASGEVVFNTGMVGYEETLTDPSYSGQILVLTYPMIGNYGVSPFDKWEFENKILKYFESDKIHIKGLIVSQYSENFSHFNASQSLAEWLKSNRIPAISNVDTRAITKKIREKGVMNGKIIFNKDIDFLDINKINLVKKVSTAEVISLGNKKSKKKVILVDCGVKNNIIRSFFERDVFLKQVPWNYDFLEEDYDGLFLSNGPGDPKQCIPLINNIKKAIKKGKPIFGICLGCQLLALAIGADTYKLKFGHRSQNQPCLENNTKRCLITSQNHGYAVDAKTLPKDWDEWFINVNDNTCEGIRHKDKPFFAVQFHPEATPGPTDAKYIFDEFIKEL